MAKPSWVRKDEPDLTDLIDLMRPHERERWERGFPTPAEREDFLAQIAARWHSYRVAAKNRPSTSDSYDLPSDLDEIKSGLLEIYRKLQTGELVEVTPSQQVLSKGTPRHSKKYYRRFRQGLFGVVGLLAAVIFERINAPTWLIVVTLAVAVLCIAILPAVERASKVLRAAFWLLLVAYVLFAGFVAIVKSQPAPATVLSAPQASPPAMATPLSEQVLGQPDAEYLIELYAKNSTAQADEAAKAYIGKLIKLSGSVRDVATDGQTVFVTMWVRPSKSTLAVVATIEKGMDRALVLRRDQRATIVGRIKRVNNMGIVLEKGEVVE